MISLYRRLEWLLKGFDSSCQLLSVKISKRHFFNTVELTDLDTKNPVNNKL